MKIVLTDQATANNVTTPYNRVTLLSHKHLSLIKYCYWNPYTTESCLKNIYKAFSFFLTAQLLDKWLSLELVKARTEECCKALPGRKDTATTLL